MNPRHLYSLPTNQPTPRTSPTPTLDGIIFIPCFHHSSCVVSFAIWFSNVRFPLEVHCMRIAWRSITISLYGVLLLRGIYWSGYTTLSHRFVHSIWLDWRLKPFSKKAGFHLQQCPIVVNCISIGDNCKNCKGKHLTYLCQVHLSLAQAFFKIGGWCKESRIQALGDLWDF